MRGAQGRADPGTNRPSSCRTGRDRRRLPSVGHKPPLARGDGLEQGDVSHVFSLPSRLAACSSQVEAMRPADRRAAAAPPRRDPSFRSVHPSLGETQALRLPSAGGGRVVVAPTLPAAWTCSRVPLNRVASQRRPRRGIICADKMEFNSVCLRWHTGRPFLLSESRDLAVRHGSSAARLCGPLCRRISQCSLLARSREGPPRGRAPLAVRYRHSVG